MRFSANSSDIIHGCLLGGALGDALAGQPSPDDAQFPAPGRFSATTQLSLYTVDALTELLEWARAGTGADETAILWLAYLRWFRGQRLLAAEHAPLAPPRWIDGQELLRVRRDPDQATLDGLATGEMGTEYRPLNTRAAGAGALARSAPIGLVPFMDTDAVYRLCLNGASLTHGSAEARHSAAAAGTIIHRLLPADATPASAVADAAADRRTQGAPEVAERLEQVLRQAHHDAGRGVWTVPLRMGRHWGARTP